MTERERERGETYFAAGALFALFVLIHIGFKERCIYEIAKLQVSGLEHINNLVS
jgi:hypothetical protein